MNTIISPKMINPVGIGNPFTRFAGNQIITLLGLSTDCAYALLLIATPHTGNYAMKLDLFYAPITCSMVPYILLTEAGAEFDVQALDFRKGEHLGADFLRVNPRHKVPVLVIDGEPLMENVAIQIWIARQFPAAKLLPDGFQEIKAISFLSWCSSGIHPALTPNAKPQVYCDLPGSEDSVKRCAQKLSLENYQLAETMLVGRDWFFDRFSCADVYFFWCFRRGMQFKMDLSGLPNCHAHFARMQQRPSVQKLLAFEAQTLAAFAKSS
jgi:glutathione S-transferase